MLDPRDFPNVIRNAIERRLWASPVDRLRFYAGVGIIVIGYVVQFGGEPGYLVIDGERMYSAAWL